MVILIFLFQLLYTQNIRLDSKHSKNWINLVSRRTIDMRGALYECMGNGDIVLMSGRSPFMLVRSYKFLGARGDRQTYYSHQINISVLYDEAPNMGLRLIEGYSLDGYELNRYAQYSDLYNEKLRKWNDKNAVYNDGRWKANKDADWNSYPVPEVEDVNWDLREYAGELY